ncbi:unnamed protein product [Enterobius vermicularis]|uniref:Transposase n=1 Tax=Enterobius vermicularis TaxID=51028 RepID=A0A0N4VE22_ENTVE|nr:unnamed protein product [Enterobius vermicularis]
MHSAYSSQKQPSVSAATIMLSQCSLQDRPEVIQKNSYCMVRQYSSELTGPNALRIQRRNAVGNLFEGIDLAVIKQLAELSGQKLQ